MANITTSREDFITMFPEFNDNQEIELYLIRAKCYISDKDYGNLSGDARKLAIYLFTAHLLALKKKIEKGQMSVGFASSANIDKVSVSMVPPPSAGAFEFWLNQTPYGGELVALLYAMMPTPLLVGGIFIRTLF